MKNSPLFTFDDDASVFVVVGEGLLGVAVSLHDDAVGGHPLAQLSHYTFVTSRDSGLPASL